MSRLVFTLLEKHETATAAKYWQALEAEIGGDWLTTTWDWVETWLNNYGDVVDYWFAVGMVHKKPVGITLLTKETNRNLPFPVAAYHIGTQAEPFCDMVRAGNSPILVQESIKSVFYTELVGFIKEKFAWEEIIFDNFPSSEAKTIKEALKKHSSLLSIDVKPTLSYDFTQARSTNTPVLKTFNSETRYTIKRSLKAFDNDLTTEWAETHEEAFAILDELIEFYNLTWEKLGRRSVFNSPRFLKFQLDIIPKLLQRKQVILFRVKSKRYGTLGCLYLLVDNGVGIGYQLGLNHFENVVFETINKKRLRTGFILHSLCMEECKRRGLKEYNFSEGLHSYKKELTNKQDEVITLSIRKSYKPLLRTKIFQLHERLLEKKQLPLLLQVVNKILSIQSSINIININNRSKNAQL